MQPSGSSSSSYTSQDPPPRSELWWDRLPSLKIVRPPKGPFSPQVDERCLTFCSQSVTGRIHGHDPWCRTLCVRRVFLHEVTRVLALHRTQTVHHEPGKRPRVELTDNVDTAPVHHPLPPEGQRYSGWLHALVASSFSSSSHPSPDHPPHPHADAHGNGNGHGHGQGDPSDVRYWKAGWYLWWSRSRWAAQERMDLMRRSLEKQTEWQHFKDRRNDDWERGAPLDESRFVDDVNRLDDLANVPPFPDVSNESVLLPIPSPLSLRTSLSAVLAPTQRVLALVRTSVESGDQAELARRLAAKACSDEPFRLLRVCCTLIWENMGFGDNDRSDSSKDGSDRGKKP
ncbi:hypothetical protein BD413DRAFT_674761 [Trametes elegans]|nr:hypothetical protein BD413DRAFT_674761 [Trametes elegans]